MKNLRIIPRLDIKGPNLIKSIQLEGLRVIGDPNVFAKKYYQQGADELLYMDVVASLYGRNSLKELISKAAKDVFIPITVGGGIRSIDDAKEILRSGADKIAINSAAVKDPSLISKLITEFGSQSIVVSIEAKVLSEGKWEVYIENGREKTGVDVLEWSKICNELGAGEIILTSIDNEGTRRGFDMELVKKVQNIIDVPLIVCGGMGKLEHFEELSKVENVDAVSMADVLHYNRLTIKEIKKYGLSKGLKIRQIYEKK